MGRRVLSEVLRLYKISFKYVKSLLDLHYPNDQSVMNDITIKLWEDLLLDPNHGNMNKITSYGTVKNRQLGNKKQLTEFITTLLNQVFQHGYSRMEVVMDSMMMGKFVPHIYGHEMFIAPGKRYSKQQILSRYPRLGAMGNYLGFMNVFLNTDTYKPMFPESGLEVNWFDGRKENEVANDFRKSIEKWLRLDLEGRPRIMNGVPMVVGGKKYNDMLVKFPLNIEV